MGLLPEGALGEDATHHTAHTEMVSPQNGRGCETSDSQSYEMPAKWKQQDLNVAVPYIVVICNNNQLYKICLWPIFRVRITTLGSIFYCDNA